MSCYIAEGPVSITLCNFIQMDDDGADWEVHWHLTDSVGGNVSSDEVSYESGDLAEVAEGGATDGSNGLHSVCLSFQRKHK
jgi:hypothetical protein